jgi:hypothetical protein
MESHRLARQCRFLFAIFCPVVRDRKKETGGCASAVLVVEPGGLAPVAFLRFILPTRFGFHLCIRIHVDSLHSQPHNPQAPQRRAHQLRWLRNSLSAPIEVLFWVWSVNERSPRSISKVNHFFGGVCGTDALGTSPEGGSIPYFARIGRMSG